MALCLISSNWLISMGYRWSAGACLAFAGAARGVTWAQPAAIGRAPSGNHPPLAHWTRRERGGRKGNLRFETATRANVMVPPAAAAQTISDGPLQGPGRLNQHSPKTFRRMPVRNHRPIHDDHGDMSATRGRRTARREAQHSRRPSNSDLGPHHLGKGTVAILLAIGRS